MTVPQDLKTTNIVDNAVSPLMDNVAYHDTESHTKPQKPQKEVQIPLQHRDIAQPHAEAGSSNISPGANRTICRPEACRRARARYSQQTSENTWNRQKATLFIIICVLFATWIVIYVILSTLHIV